ncbi:MAG TPA: permease-like cell division protein FtsX [Chitinophagales bacterium]|nr:permease-like cell division protein FtsX [Chitinophagales bacterium]
MSESRKKTARRFKPNYIYSIISTALVLFMIGLLALLFIHGNKLGNQFKENIEFTVIVKDNVSEKSILALQKRLDAQPWVKSSKYISKEAAAKIFTQENQEDFKDLLDYNPLFASVNLKLKSGYTSKDSIDAIEQRVMKYSEVGEFYYERQLVEMLNDNLRKISWVIIGISLLLVLLAIGLIDSTIRLSMYSSRFLIRSMQLVGATRSFVTWPFTKKSLQNGLIASGIAILALMTLLNFAISQVPELMALQDATMLLLVYTGILLLGLLFSYLSTHFAVNKYLRMKLDELY